jgi:cyclopropane fatty-acyl-phospholipid synthase-like methyltransferase
MKQYNTTQLNPDQAFERHIYHRDQFAHYLRWTHVFKHVKPLGEKKVLDYGCGSGNLAEVLYRNRYRCKNYLGLDVRQKTIDENNEKFSKVDWVEFDQEDLVKTCGSKALNMGYFDVITCFEVVEHIGKKNIHSFLENMSINAHDETIILLSTPNYDPKVGAAKNHIIDGEICEFDHFELQDILKEYFYINEKYGTFASQKDYRELLNDWQREFYDRAHHYWDSNLLSNIMAPMFPEQSRNCLWVMKRKM